MTKRLATVAALSLVMIALSSTVPGMLSRAQAPGQNESAISALSFNWDDDELLSIDVRLQDGSEWRFKRENFETPTETPLPSATIPPTNTPRASSTPAATETPLYGTSVPTYSPTPVSPTPTITPTSPFDVSTPTPESTPVPTPSEPTSTPGPKNVCSGNVANTSGLTLRSSPNVPTSGQPSNVIAVYPQTTPLEITRFYVYQDALNEWAYVKLRDGREGWMAAIYYSGRKLITWDESSEFCYPPHVIVTYHGGGGPTSSRPAVFIHAVPGANAWELRLAYNEYRLAGLDFGVKAVNETQLCHDAVNAGGECIYRSVHPSDCPNVLNPNPKQEALLWLIAISPYTVAQSLPSERVWVEIVNECNMDNLSWWNEFLLEFIRLARERGWPPLVAPTWNPGAPDPEDLDELRSALVALRDAGGMLGLHAYSIYREVGLCESDEWLGYRHRQIRAKLNAMGLSSLDIAITEAARGAGELPPSIDDFTCWVCSVMNEPGLHDVSLWLAGVAFPWGAANLNGRLVDLAQSIHLTCGA